MRAMVLPAGGRRLQCEDVDPPVPADGQVRVAVKACGVCRTDLHVVDRDLADPGKPVVPGHEVVGVVEALGPGVSELRVGQRVGIPWLGWTCGACDYCVRGQENLCEKALFTGYTLPGGYADHVVADSRYTFPIAGDYDDVEAAPLLCAGLIGYRSLRMAGEGRRLGIYGFGAAAHIIAQVAVWQGREVYAFVRAGDDEAADFARTLGAVWAGPSDRTPPAPLDAAIIFAPVGALVPKALAAVRPGGIVVCAGIHMSDIPSFPYALLWRECTLRSVANLTRRDAQEFLDLAPRVPVRTTTVPFPLSQANEALDRLRNGQIRGAAVLVPDR